MKTLRGRFWLGFGGLLLILILVSALSVIVLTRYSRVLQQVFRENYNSAVYCDQMKDAKRTGCALPSATAGREFRRNTPSVSLKSSFGCRGKRGRVGSVWA